MNLFILFLEFFKTGLFAVGGGLATLPFLFEMAASREWFDYEMVGNILAIAQASPGPIGVNMAAQAGFLAGGLCGCLIAVFALICPQITIVLLMCALIKTIRENAFVMSLFSGLRPAATGLLAAAGFGILKTALYNADAAAFFEFIFLKELAILAAFFIAVYKLKINPVILIASGAAAGILLGL